MAMLPLLFWLVLAPSDALSPDLKQIRTQYYQSVTDEDAAGNLYRQLVSVSNPPAIILGYRAATEALFAKHLWNPYAKLTWLDKAEETFAKAIRLDPANVEIRFLRFSYQHYLPGFLKRSPNLDEDRAAIVTGLSNPSLNTDPDLRKNVIRFLLESGRCSPSEESVLRSLL